MKTITKEKELHASTIEELRKYLESNIPNIINSLNAWWLEMQAEQKAKFKEKKDSPVFDEKSYQNEKAFNEKKFHEKEEEKRKQENSNFGFSQRSESGTQNKNFEEKQEERREEKPSDGFSQNAENNNREKKPNSEFKQQSESTGQSNNESAFSKSSHSEFSKCNQENNSNIHPDKASKNGYPIIPNFHRKLVSSENSHWLSDFCKSNNYTPKVNRDNNQLVLAAPDKITKIIARMDNISCLVKPNDPDENKHLSATIDIYIQSIKGLSVPNHEITSEDTHHLDKLEKFLAKKLQEQNLSEKINGKSINIILGLKNENTKSQSSVLNPDQPCNEEEPPSMRPGK
jgi:hypothetical protein